MQETLGKLTGGMNLPVLIAPERPPPRTCTAPEYLELLVEELAKLPSIGQKSAQRLALHLLRGSQRGQPAARRGDPRGQGAGGTVQRVRQLQRRGPVPLVLRSRA